MRSLPRVPDMRSIKGSNSCRWSMVVLAPQAYGGSTTVSNMCSKTFWTRSSFPARVSNRRSPNICSGGFHEPVRSALVPSSGRRRDVVPTVLPGAIDRAGGRLRLVTEAPSAARTSSAARRAELPVELTRRPVAPRAGRPADLPGMRPADLAPHHPAVRAQRRRELQARYRGAVRGEASGSSARGPHRAPPVGLRRLAAVSCLTLAAVMVIALGIAATGFAGAPGGTTTATVQIGQSLWEVAAQTGTGDVGETVTRIVELNGLTSSSVEPGQVLVVPVE